jgi:hypothetical protein
MLAASERTATTLLDRRPQARTFSVQDLLDVVARGRMRIPSFQRGLKWDRMNARLRLESLYRSWPARCRKAEAVGARARRRAQQSAKA